MSLQLQTVTAVAGMVLGFLLLGGVGWIWRRSGSKLKTWAYVWLAMGCALSGVYYAELLGKQRVIVPALIGTVLVYGLLVVLCYSHSQRLTVPGKPLFAEMAIWVYMVIITEVEVIATDFPRGHTLTLVISIPIALALLSLLGMQHLADTIAAQRALVDHSHEMMRTSMRELVDMTNPQPQDLAAFAELVRHQQEEERRLQLNLALAKVPIFKRLRPGWRERITEEFKAAHRAEEKLRR